MSCDIVRRILVGGWFVVALGLFAYVVTRAPLGRIADACTGMGPAVLLAPLIAATWIATRTRTLELVLARTVAWRALLRVRFVGDGYNALVPAAGLAGEPFKVRQLLRWLPADRAVTGLVRDRFVDNALGLLFSAAGIAIGLPRVAIPAVARGALWTYAGIAAVAGLVHARRRGHAGARAARRGREPVDPRQRPAPEPLPVALAVRAVGWAFATRVLQTLETTLLLACIGAPVSVSSVLLVDGVLNAAGFVGFLMPQGLGVVEGAAVYILGALGSPAAAATAFALARRGRMLVVGGAGIALHLGGELRAWFSEHRQQLTRTTFHFELDQVAAVGERQRRVHHAVDAAVLLAALLAAILRQVLARDVGQHPRRGLVVAELEVALGRDVEALAAGLAGPVHRLTVERALVVVDEIERRRDGLPCSLRSLSQRTRSRKRSERFVRRPRSWTTEKLIATPRSQQVFATSSTSSIVSSQITVLTRNQIGWRATARSSCAAS